MIKLKKIRLKESSQEMYLSDSKMNKILGGFLNNNPTLPQLTERPVSTSVTMAPGTLKP